MTAYIGRFAPSPTGLLHAGSLVAALASWLDARAHGGTVVAGAHWGRGRPALPAGHGCADPAAARQLGLRPDAPPDGSPAAAPFYEAAPGAFDRRRANAFGCACTRAEIAPAAGPRQRHGEIGLPRRLWNGTHGPPGVRGLALPQWTAASTGGTAGGRQTQDLAVEVGATSVLKRADGLWAYQLAVVVDDADQGITDIVRGEGPWPTTRPPGSRCNAPSARRCHATCTPLVAGAGWQKLSSRTAPPRWTPTTWPLGCARSAGVLGPQASGADLLPSLVTAWAGTARRQWLNSPNRISP